MKLSCDHCSCIASGTEDELIDVGWTWIQISTPIKKRFVGCPDHEKMMAQAAWDAIEKAGGRRICQ